jgi:hypothetical protein
MCIRAVPLTLGDILDRCDFPRDMMLFDPEAMFGLHNHVLSPIPVFVEPNVHEEGILRNPRCMQLEKTRK